MEVKGLRQPFLKPAGRWAIALAVTGALVTSGVGIYQLYSAKKQATAPPIPTATIQPVRAVSALGRLEPQGEVIQLSAPSSLQGTSRVDKLLITEGDKVAVGQIVAILDNRDRLQAALEKAKQQVKVAQVNLAKVKAGAKAGEIAAQKAEIARLEAQRQGEITTQQATIARLEAQLSGEKKAQQAKIARLEAQLEGEIKTQEATVARLVSPLRNAENELKRYQQLYEQGAVDASRYESKRLEVETARERLNEAQSTLNTTKATLQQQIAEAKATLDQTKATLQQQIAEAKANLERIKATYQKQIKQAEATLNQISEVRPVDVQAANAEIQNAIAAQKQAQAELELAYVRTPKAGQILKIHTRPGETISNNGIADLGQTDQMYVVAEIYESDIGKVRLGQSATITSQSNAFSGEIRGKVSQIGLQIGKKDILDTDPAADVDARVVEVKISLNPDDSRSVAGLTNSKVMVKISI